MEAELDTEVEYTLQIFFLNVFPFFLLHVSLTSSVLSLPYRMLKQLCICGLHLDKKGMWERLLLVPAGEG